MKYVQAIIQMSLVNFFNKTRKLGFKCAAQEVQTSLDKLSGWFDMKKHEFNIYTLNDF